MLVNGSKLNVVMSVVSINFSLKDTKVDVVLIFVSDDVSLDVSKLDVVLGIDPNDIPLLVSYFDFKAMVVAEGKALNVSNFDVVTGVGTDDISSDVPKLVVFVGFVTVCMCVVIAFNSVVLIIVTLVLNVVISGRLVEFLFFVSLYFVVPMLSVIISVFALISLSSSQGFILTITIGSGGGIGKIINSNLLTLLYELSYIVLLSRVSVDKEISFEVSVSIVLNLFFPRMDSCEIR